MVGIATETVQLDAHRNSFVSLLGKDADSWGLSYYGRIQNRGAFSQMSKSRKSKKVLGNRTKVNVTNSNYMCGQLSGKH